MAEKYMFFNSTANDRRKYGAQDMAMYWESFIRSGLIHENREPLLRVQADNATMSLSVENGKAILAGHLYLKEGHVPLTVKLSGATEDRFDRVVLQLSNEPGKEGSRYIRLKIIEGSKEGPPTLRREQIEGRILHYELSLAQIHVKAGKSYLEQSDIIDERLDEELCGLASSLVTVPSDVFTEEWKEFVAEYNKWFSDLQGSAFATVDDVRVSENNMKREIANLNLQLEASKRVKEGVTFGTNFADSFGMEIDMARTSSDNALIVGQKEITVRDASDFKVGTEVTIYDDVNLERVIIEDISGDVITLEKALDKDYKEGVNIARSMIVQKFFNRHAEFGVWGTYQYVDATDRPSKFNAGTNRSSGYNKFVRFQDAWYCVAITNTLPVVSKLKDDEGVWEDIIASDNASEQFQILNHNNHLVVIAYGHTIERILIRTLRFDDMQVDQKTISLKDADGTLLSNRLQDLSLYVDEEGVIRIRTGSSVTSFLALRIGKDGIINAEPLRTYFANVGAATGIENSHPYHRYVDGKYIFIGPASYSTSKYLRMYTFEEDGSSPYKDLPVPGTTPSVVTTQLIIMDDGTWKYYTHDMERNLYVATSDDEGVTWASNKVNTTVSKGGLNGYFYWSYNGNLIFFDGTFFEIDVSTDELVRKEYDFGTTLPSNLLTSSSVAPIFEEGVDVPFIHVTTKIVGKGELGYGSEITKNDIRFKTKPSKEVVTWLQHDEGLTVTEATFGNINLDLTAIGDETQAVGYTTKEQDEVRLTIERQSIDDDVKTYRILGGTS